MIPIWLIVLVLVIGFVAYWFYLKDYNISAPKGFEKLPAPGNGNLNVYFLDIGQGDCSIIVFPDNKTMIIDSGNQYNAQKQKIKEFTDFLNIETFDYLLLTHADADHVGSMDHVFENYEVKHVFRPNVLSTYSRANELNEEINRGFTSAEGGTPSSSASYFKFLLGLQNEEGCTDEIFNKDSDFSGTYATDDGEYEYVFDFLTPVAEVDDIKYKNANDYSPIVSLSYNGTVIVFTGDAESVMEKEFLDHYSIYPDADLLKVGHHGSDTSSGQNFLNAVKPEYAVIQCGTGNSYKHPKQVTLNKLSAIGASVYRNDTNGDIAVSIGIASDYKFNSDMIFCVNTDVSKNHIGGDAQ